MDGDEDEDRGDVESADPESVEGDEITEVAKSDELEDGDGDGK